MNSQKSNKPRLCGKRETTKIIPVTDSNSILFIICGIHKNI